MNHEDPILTGIENFDQVREIAHLEEWVKRVATRPRRDILCRGILELIRQDVLRYGYCRTTSGIRPAFAMVRERQDMSYVVDAAYPDTAAGGLLIGLIQGALCVKPGYTGGEPDLVFSGLARWFGPIHEHLVRSKLV
jgi:hypothetical protein